MSVPYFFEVFFLLMSVCPSCGYHSDNGLVLRMCNRQDLAVENAKCHKTRLAVVEANVHFRVQLAFEKLGRIVEIDLVLPKV